MKKILLSFFTFFFSVSILSSFAQKLPDNWYNLDPVQDTVLGMSTEKAYQTFLKGKKSTTVIVAVIDGGVDTAHVDLKEHIWTNPREIPGNGIDDDGNGYVDDVHGWDFIGGKTENVNFDNEETTRIYRKYKDVFENNPAAAAKDKELYATYSKAKDIFTKRFSESQKGFESIKKVKDWMDKMEDDICKDSITHTDIDNYVVQDSVLMKTKTRFVNAMKKGKLFNDFKKEINNSYNRFSSALRYAYNLDFDPRNIVGDNYEDASERYYGNNNVKGPAAEHGTHVSGIIAAVRNNDIGINGVADNVQIMALRAVPNGDERDKDIANAIRYAAENGAKIINMSFGKAFPYNKKAVDDAVKFALQKDVLFIHAAGNDASNLDKEKRYPNFNFENSKENARAAWIEVGANAASGKAANFSNYGKKYVDLFAPGVKIYSCLPENKYENFNGTSMAAPMVAGVAAIIRAYYPNLSAKQVKEVLIKSVWKLNTKVPAPGNPKKMLKFKKLCNTKGVVNVYNALELLSKGKM